MIEADEAELRTAAMALSDGWVAARCLSMILPFAQQRLAQVASFTALREVSDRGGLPGVSAEEAEASENPAR
jgi:hypothetical protein